MEEGGAKWSEVEWGRGRGRQAGAGGGVGFGYLSVSPQADLGRGRCLGTGVRCLCLFGDLCWLTLLSFWVMLFMGHLRGGSSLPFGECWLSRVHMGRGQGEEEEEEEEEVEEAEEVEEPQTSLRPR